MSKRVLISNAKIYDGSGQPPFFGSFCIEDGRFSGVFRDQIPVHQRYDEIHDAAGFSVTPGFIDVHAHSDLTLFAAPGAFSKLSQGITTEISGNCGHSLFPVTHHNRDQMTEECVRLGVQCTWHSFNEYRAALAQRHPYIRTFFFCGHNTLASAYPDNPRAQSAALQTAISQGALGLSTGLLYAPGRDAPQEHLLQLMDVLRQTDAFYSTHLRSEGTYLQEAINEAINLAKHGSRRLHISHLKTAGQANWYKLPDILETIRINQIDGMQITADRYPYIHSQTSFSIVLPEKYDSMRDFEIQRCLANNPKECERLVAELESSPRIPNVILTATSRDEFRPYIGRTIKESAASVGLSPASLTIQILRNDAACAMAAFPGMSSDNLNTILSKSYVCCGTDENARPLDNSIGCGHPRGFGSFPIFIKRVAALSSMEEAIHRVTLLPASIFRLSGIGAIQTGYRADFVLLDENKLGSHADFCNPHTPADGILEVFVNGKSVYQNF